jgi:hypothetical protein
VSDSVNAGAPEPAPLIKIIGGGIMFFGMLTLIAYLATPRGGYRNPQESWQQLSDAEIRAKMCLVNWRIEHHEQSR